jgi:hypothetical protein
MSRGLDRQPHRPDQLFRSRAGGSLADLSAIQRAMKTNLTEKSFRSGCRSCAPCKPQKMHWEDSRIMQTVKASIGHQQQLGELSAAASD